MILALLILISLSISAVADDGFDVEQQENSDILEETINELNQNKNKQKDSMFKLDNTIYLYNVVCFGCCPYCDCFVL